MPVSLKSLREPNDLYEVEEAAVGLILIRKGDRGRFSSLVRRLIDEGQDEYVVLPSTDGGIGYDQAVILAFDRPASAPT